MIEALLVANRGEIAVRAFRAANELGVRSIAIYAPEDRDSVHRLKADESYEIGEPGHPVSSYLDARADRRAGASQRRRRRDLPRLRLPRREPGARARLRGRRRSASSGPPAEVLGLAGDKTRAREVARAAGVPVLEASGPVRDARGRAGRGDGARLPAVRQGRARRRRARDAPGRVARRSCRARSTARCARRRRRSATAPSTSSRRCCARAPHRGADPRRLRRRHRPPVRARLLAAAAPPEGDRGDAGAEPRRRAARADLRGGGRGRARDRLRQRRHRRVPARRGRALRVHRDEPAHPGRAHGHRGDHRRRPRARADPDRRRRDARGARPRARRRSASAASRCSAASRPRTRRTASAPTPGGSPPTARRAAPASGSTRARPSSAPRSRRSSTRCWSRSPRAAPICAAPRRAPDAPSPSCACAASAPTRRSCARCCATPTFLAGDVHTTFVDEHPELIAADTGADRASRLLARLTDVTINREREPPAQLVDPRAKLPPLPPASRRAGSRQRLRELGPAALRGRAARRSAAVALTDTTLRDAHQSLLATRMRTFDMVAVAPADRARRCPGLLSLECWGGATFDVALRFLHEDPWERLERLREAVPNICLQMLLRGGNLLAYSRFEPAVVRGVRRRGGRGRRRRDPDLRRAQRHRGDGRRDRRRRSRRRRSSRGRSATRATSARPRRAHLHARLLPRASPSALVGAGVHVLAIKDMAGLLRAPAARTLVERAARALRRARAPAHPRHRRRLARDLPRGGRGGRRRARRRRRAAGRDDEPALARGDRRGARRRPRASRP